VGATVRKLHESDENIIVVSDAELLLIEQTLAPPAPSPAPAPAPSPYPTGAFFYDDFNYVIDRDITNANALFTAQKTEYSRVKATNEAGENPDSGGNLYTVDSIEGFNGSFPNPTSRALCMEARPDLYNMQTDFYIEVDSGDGTPLWSGDTTWWQFWVYIQNDPTSGKVTNMRSLQAKFFYPCHNPNYNCQDNEYDFLLSREVITGSVGGFFYEGAQDLSDGFIFTYQQSGVTVFDSAIPYAGKMMYHNSLDWNTRNVVHTPNNWYQLTMCEHRSATAGARYRMWSQAQSDPNPTKLMDFEDGVTILDVDGSTLNFQSSHDYEHQKIRFPTTFGRSNETDFSGGVDNAWIYLQDLCYAPTNDTLKSPIPDQYL